MSAEAMIGRGPRAAVLGWCLGLDPLLFLALHAGQLGVAATLVVHFSGTLAVILPRLQAGRRDDRLLQLGVWTALGGPFGAAIGMALFVPRARPGAQATAAVPDAADASPQRRHDALHDALLDGRVRLGGGRGVRPLLDTVIEGTTAAKLDALAVIAKRYVPALAPALKRGLQDADGSVRVLAATVMAQLHNTHTKRIGRLQEIARATPTAAAWQALGEARRAYAASGLLEPDRANREAQEGLACLERAGVLDAAPQPPGGSGPWDRAAGVPPEGARHAA